MSAGTVGIVTNDPYNVFQRAVISGIREVMDRSHYDVEICSFNDKVQPSAVMLSELTNFDGLIVISNVLAEDTLRSLYRHGKPISLISHHVPDIPIPVVVSNNQQGIAELVYHLVKRCQRRNILFIRGLMEQMDAQERELAFRQELIRHNLQIPSSFFLRGDFIPDIAAESLQALLSMGVEFDSIVACDYVMAIAVLEVLRSSGIAVPGAVSVVGFGDNPQAEAAGLTTVAASITELGACAARQLLSQLSHFRIRGVTVLSVRLMVRQTCGYQVVSDSERGLEKGMPIR